jgi:ribonuclease BN (tRNA processing enzyme)
MSFAVTVLGSSGKFQTLERAAAGYLIELDGKHIWMDAGSGTWRNLLGMIDYTELDGIVLSHRHPDHTSDVLQAYHARCFGHPEPLHPIPLWAPAETVEHLRGFCGESASAFSYTVIDDSTVLELGSARLSFVHMAHPVETLGVRLDYDGRLFAYSSDTGESADFGALATDADVFVCEATLQDSDEIWEGHLRASQAAAIAREIGARKLVLSHLPPGRDLQRSLAEARGVADGADVQLASDGRRLEVG